MENSSYVIYIYEGIFVKRLTWCIYKQYIVMEIVTMEI